MLKLIIGNKAYSSWSLRGWLAVKQSGLAFEEITVPLFDEEWDKRTQCDEFAPSGGKVPILWDDATVIWDSLAIVEWLADKIKASDLADVQRATEEEARRHPAAHPEIIATSSEKGLGMDRLRAAVLEAALL